MYFIGVIIGFVGVLLSFYFRGIPIAFLINPAAVVIILFAVIGAIVATSSFKVFIRGINAIFSAKYEISEEECLQASNLFRLLGKCTLLASMVCVFIGIIAALANMYDQEVIAHAISAAFVGIIHGLVLLFAVFEPAAHALKKPRRQFSSVQVYPKHVGDRLLELCIQNGLTPEEIESATGIQLRHGD